MSITNPILHKKCYSNIFI